MVTQRVVEACWDLDRLGNVERTGLKQPEGGRLEWRLMGGEGRRALDRFPRNGLFYTYFARASYC